MDWIVSAAGALLVAAALRDVFHTLFHPGGQGGLSRLLLSGTWRMARRVGGRERLGELAGPLGTVAVILTWGVLVVVGGALVYWPHIPEAFSYATGLQPGRRAAWLDALYLSLVATSTLGLGDIVPTSGWLRAVTPVQALIGFALLTAAVSWVLQIYPALNRRRKLAARLTSLHGAAAHEQVAGIDGTMPALLLEDLADQITQVTVDLTQYAETYYFRDQDDRISLPATVGYAADLAAEGSRSPRPEVRLAAADLTCALEALARLLGRSFLRAGGSLREVLAAYADDHGRTAVLGSRGDEGTPPLR